MTRSNTEKVVCKRNHIANGSYYVNSSYEITSLKKIQHPFNERVQSYCYIKDSCGKNILFDVSAIDTYFREKMECFKLPEWSPENDRVPR
jgi:hypothetical protein